MTADEQFQRAVEIVQREAQACSAPELDIADLTAVVQGVQAAPLWQPATAYGVGDQVTADPPNGVIYSCTTAGTSDTVPPAWPAPTAAASCYCSTAGSVTDGTVAWQQVSTYLHLYDVAQAITDAWRLKMGRAANLVAQSSAGQAYQMQQVAIGCRRMIAAYRPGRVA